jgi:hypothetical protein
LTVIVEVNVTFLAVHEVDVFFDADRLNEFVKVITIDIIGVKIWEAVLPLHLECLPSSWLNPVPIQFNIFHQFFVVETSRKETVLNQIMNFPAVLANVFKDENNVHLVSETGLLRPIALKHVVEPVVEDFTN